MNKIIDAHIHLDLYKESDQQKLLDKASVFGIDYFIAVSMNESSCYQVKELSKNNRVLPAYGFHPEQTIPSYTDQERLLSFLKQEGNSMIAIGEIGLPHYSKLENPTLPYEPYIELAEEQIKIAKKFDLPVIIHGVYEDSDTMCELLERHSITHAHFHWYKGEIKQVERLIRNGFYVSFTPNLVYEEEIQEIAKVFPREQVMLETDGPWPFEGPFKGKMTHSNMIHESIQHLGFIWKEPTDYVYEHIYTNTMKFFKI
ncbi:hypothetical protein Q73_03115 [Bacillus coahuilensis m2-6]|uniref:TatD family hydrolase n=1 Tax=Bacillus coahuilensis TaxID=408580 RepID=UPI0001850AC1|nr:TatD family hydrolase [Bacillus coahuilensis]KUP09283.1 hypothetical protein Q73_03115 [Bacillus coahuilensis m2-6]